MATLCTVNFAASLLVPRFPGTSNEEKYTVPFDASFLAETNGLAQIILAPQDFVLGSGSSPLMEIDLSYGGPFVDFDGTAGGGGEIISHYLKTEVDGIAPDFTKLRNIVAVALPEEEGSPSKISAMLRVGNFASVNANTAALPLAYDSAETDRTPASGGLCAVPRGINFSSSYKLTFTVFEALNTRVTLMLLGN